MEALQRRCDGMEAWWVGRWTEAERRSATEIRGDFVSIEINAKSWALYKVACY
jgi:hypothetical protein